MRRLLILLAMAVLSCGSTPQVEEIINGRILFLGDSITQDGRYVSIIEYELLKRYPGVDLISIGLSSETVSGLTEPNHPYPRPCIHDRLERALSAIKPKTVFACYGMNDGIYHPQSEERFQAYKDGIQKLIDAVRAAGATPILLTPPTFDPLPIAHKTVDRSAPLFGYASPFVGYNDVLAEYGKWLLSLQPAVQVIDLNTAMLHYTRQRRADDSTFTLAPDGVHPQWVGHALMAQQVLSALGVPTAQFDPAALATQLENDDLFQRAHQRRQMRSAAWLVEIGYEMPMTVEALPVAEAEMRAAAEKSAIVSALK